MTGADMPSRYRAGRDLTRSVSFVIDRCQCTMTNASRSPPASSMPDTRRPHFMLSFSVLAVAAASYSLMQSLVAPALPEIQHDLHTTANAAAWILTAYLLSASIFTPILGRLGDMLGKERVLVWALLALAVGTVICAVSTSIGPM